MDLSCSNVIEICAEQVGTEYDPAATRSSISRAIREIPGSWDDAWAARLMAAGMELGLRGSRTEATVSDAAKLASPETPVLARIGGSGNESNEIWLILVGQTAWRVRVRFPLEWDGVQDLKISEIVRLAGLRNLEQLVEWVVFRTIAPLEGMGASVESTHGHGSRQAHMSPFRRLIQLVKPERGDIASVLMYAVGVGIFSLATPLAVEAVVTTVAMNQLAQQLLTVSLLLLGCLGIASALRGLQGFVAEIIQRRIFVRVATDLAYRLPRVRVDAFDGVYGPEQVNRFFDVLTVQKVGAQLLVDGVAIVLQASAGLVVLAFYHPYLLGFDGVVLMVLAFILILLGRGAISTSIEESRAKYAVAGCLEELTVSPGLFKQADGQSWAIDRAETLTRRYLTARRQHYSIILRQVIFALGFQAIATTSLLGLGGWLVIEGQLTLGQLVAAELIVVTVIGSFAKLGKHIENWYDLMAAVEKIGHLVDLPLERADGENHDPLTHPASLHINNLSFAYHGNHKVIDDLSLVVNPGERIALIGPGGSGKTTFVDLLYGLRKPDSGFIGLDGLNIRDLNLCTLRKHVAVVKEPEILDGTILENLRVGREEITLSEIRQALEDVGLLDSLLTLPDAFHTKLSIGGAPLSLSQARRLTLARAIVGKPRLLILDGVLDGFDEPLRDRICAALFAVDSTWTLLVITNNHEVVGRCDRAYQFVADHGGHGASFKDMKVYGHSQSVDHGNT